MSDALSWLRAREQQPPDPLARRIEAALHDLDGAGDDVPRALGDAAFACLHASLAAGPSRAAALDLLAADALLTYAWEAAADGGAESLERFAAQCAPARFQALLPEHA
jgi:hypothetical protein